MTYRAKDLPAWVRFRPKMQPLPVYTVPTRWEHQIAALAATSARILARWNEMEPVFLRPNKPLRVMLPANYTTTKPI